MRALSVIEAAALVSVGASVLSVVVPSFVRNVHASYVSEATSGVSQVALRAATLLESQNSIEALPESAPLTPSKVPRGVRVKDPTGTWDHPTWRSLEFGFDSAHAYSFSFDAQRSPGSAKFVVLAHGDLDGDGALSTVQMEGSFVPGTPPKLSAMDVQHEIE